MRIFLKPQQNYEKEADVKPLQKRTNIPTTYPVVSYVLVEYPQPRGGGRRRPNKLQTIRKTTNEGTCL